MDVEITDDVAQAALRIYVQHSGKPHDAMRAAIISTLPHLALPAKDGPRVDGEYWTKRFDRIDEALADLRRDDIAWIQEVVDAYEKGKAFVREGS